MFTAIIDSIVYIAKHYKESLRIEISFRVFDKWITYKVK